MPRVSRQHHQKTDASPGAATSYEAEFLMWREQYALDNRFRVDHRPERKPRCSGNLVCTSRKVVVFV
jgi:hypothetical protein